MKALLLTLLILLSSGCTDLFASRFYYVAKNLPKLGAGVHKHPYRIPAPLLHLKRLNKQPLCTGFVIDDNYALTAAHCVSDIPGGKVLISDAINKPLGEAEVVAFFVRTDYALIKADFSEIEPAPIAYNVAVGRQLEGVTVFTVGFPMGQDAVVATPARLLGPSNSAIYAHGELYPGMSGGPVVLPGLFGQYTVIGVVTGSFDGSDLIVISPLMGLGGAFNLEPDDKS